MKNRLLLLAAAFTLLCACPKRVVINGVTYDYEDAAHMVYDDAVATREQGDAETALAKLDSFVAKFPESRLADDALFAIGTLARDIGQLKRAREAFARIALDYPSSDHSIEARLAMAQIDVETGNPADAVAPLRAVYDQLEGDERQEAALLLARTLDEAGDGGRALEWYLKAYESARSTEEQRELYDRIFALVDSKLSFRDVRTASESVDTRSPIGELLLFKLARILCHLRDYQQCNEAIAHYLDEHPEGRFAPPAQELADRLRARLAVDPTVIGVVLPLSGKYEKYGQRALHAIQLGAEVAGAETPGGVRLVVRDSRGESDGASRAIEELALKEHAIVVIGAILQNTAIASALKAEELGVPLVSFSRREKLTELGGYVFRYGLTNSKQAKTLVELTMGKLGMKRFAILYPRHPYGVELMNAFWDEVDSRHGSVMGAEAYDHDETTFKVPIRKLVGRHPLHTRGDYTACMAEARTIEKAYARRKAQEGCKDQVAPAVDFDAILLPDDARTVGLIAPALDYEDILITKDPRAIKDYYKTTGFRQVKPVQILGANGWYDPILVDHGGKKVEGALFVDGFNPSSSEPHVKKFVAAFTEAQKSRPTVIEAQAHDGAKLVASLLRGTAATARPKDRAGMRTLISQAREFPGVTGLTHFDETGDSVTPLVVFTIEDGAIQVAEFDEKPEG